VSVQAQVDEAVQDLDFDKFNYQITLETSAGTIRLELAPDKAPGHCRNMLGLTRIGFYNQRVFHRVIEGFMIQGGCPQGTGTGGPGYQIPAEFNDMPHEEGVLSMARSSNPDSAGSQFFICLGRHTHLDGQYTAFGKTVDDDSLKVVRQIGGCPTNAQDRPLTDVLIQSASVVEVPK